MTRQRPAEEYGDAWGPGPVRRPGWLWWTVAVGAVLAAVGFAVARSPYFVEALRTLRGAHLAPLVGALLLEAVSLVCFAAAQRRLLEFGGVSWRLRRVTSIAVAGNAVAGALPGGTAFASFWAYRQLTLRGVGPFLAAAVLLVSGTLSVLALLVLVLVGVVVAGVYLGLTALAVGLAAGLVAWAVLLARVPAVRRRARRAWRRLARRFAWLRRGRATAAHLVARARETHPGVRPWLWPSLFALLYWLFDLAVLIVCLAALGTRVPWHGVLLAYALTQVVGSLRITPGSLVLVEATLSALLVAHGVPAGQAIAATLLYRVFNYWLAQPAGWACWGVLTVRGRSLAARATE